MGDGNDGSFGEPNRAGLNGFDITGGGNGEFLTFFVVTDLPTQYTVQLYDSASGVCEVQISVSPTPDGYTWVILKLIFHFHLSLVVTKILLVQFNSFFHLLMLLMLLLDVFPFLVLPHLNLTPQLVLLLQPQQDHLLQLEHQHQQEPQLQLQQELLLLPVLVFLFANAQVSLANLFILTIIISHLILLATLFTMILIVPTMLFMFT